MNSNGLQVLVRILGLHGILRKVIDFNQSWCVDSLCCALLVVWWWRWCKNCVVGWPEQVIGQLNSPLPMIEPIAQLYCR